MKTKLAIAILFGCVSLAAQPAFETASIHTNNEADRPGRPIAHVTSDSLIMRNNALLYLIIWAYDVPFVQVDGPPWLREVWFDVQAKAAHPATETEMRLMLRKLLEDRFGLKLHAESRVMPAYALTLTKDGPKFQEEAAPGDFNLDRANAMTLIAHHARVADLAQGISGEIGRPVVDETGLQGRYEIRLNLAPYIARAGEPGGNPGQLDVMSILFTGLQEQLGLKLESKKLSVDILVIDHVEKTPTEN
ncbi:MAG TPA: TIGR03435 family protein [Bryobacteraceae bacterium]|nr:TIGR03435 family protein [Bryobacteraceae bacterium]